jgi:hypothetical protein
MMFPKKEKSVFRTAPQTMYQEPSMSLTARLGSYCVQGRAYVSP